MIEIETAAWDNFSEILIYLLKRVFIHFLIILLITHLQGDFR